MMSPCERTTFYGGIAHVPVSSLILVSELAGIYDLLVPLMLSVGVAFIALRRRSLYEAQVPTHADSPVHRPGASLDSLASVLVGTVMHAAEGHIVLHPGATMAEMGAALSSATWQRTFPVVDRDGRIVGMVESTSIASLLPDSLMPELAVAADLLQLPTTVEPENDLRRAIELLVSSSARQLPVVRNGIVVGYVDESNVTRAHLTLLERDRPI